MNEIRVTHQDITFGYKYEIRIIDKENYSFALPLTMKCEKERILNGEAVRVDPICELTKDELVILMNNLWNLGIRPTNGAGDNNAFEAVKYHLEDMRKLVFKDKK